MFGIVEGVESWTGGRLGSDSQKSPYAMPCRSSHIDFQVPTQGPVSYTIRCRSSTSGQAYDDHEDWEEEDADWNQEKWPAANGTVLTQANDSEGRLS